MRVRGRSSNEGADAEGVWRRWGAGTMGMRCEGRLTRKEEDYWNCRTRLDVRSRLGRGGREDEGGRVEGGGRKRRRERVVAEELESERGRVRVSLAGICRREEANAAAVTGGSDHTISLPRTQLFLSNNDTSTACDRCSSSSVGASALLCCCRRRRGCAHCGAQCWR